MNRATAIPGAFLCSSLAAAQCPAAGHELCAKRRQRYRKRRPRPRRSRFPTRRLRCRGAARACGAPFAWSRAALRHGFTLLRLADADARRGIGPVDGHGPPLDRRVRRRKRGHARLAYSRHLRRWRPHRPLRSWKCWQGSRQLALRVGLPLLGGVPAVTAECIQYKGGLNLERRRSSRGIVGSLRCRWHGDGEIDTLRIPAIVNTRTGAMCCAGATTRTAP